MPLVLYIGQIARVVPLVLYIGQIARVVPLVLYNVVYIQYWSDYRYSTTKRGVILVFFGIKIAEFPSYSIIQYIVVFQDSWSLFLTEWSVLLY